LIPTEARLLSAFVIAFMAVLVLTPLAISLANRLQLWDHPLGYKAHAAPTPYLGGAAVVAGVVGGGLALGGEFVQFAPVLAAMLVLAAVGLVDDWRTLQPEPRLVVEGLAGALLWATGFGWDVAASAQVNLVLTVAWVVALVNAFNLMDNIDGATSTVAAVSCGGAMALAAGEPEVAVLAAALGGACLGFLRYNLARPARIFLGDGGSMPIGFVIAAILMSVPTDEAAPWTILVPATFVAGLPLMDTCLVIVSRRRRRVAVCQGGRDHTTHRLHKRLLCTRKLAGVLAIAQGLLCVAALVAFQGDVRTTLAAGGLFAAAGVVAVALLENPQWLGTIRRPTSQPAGGDLYPGLERSEPAVSAMLLTSSRTPLDNE
jgi:UDP-N-acetylmuramyl pentapeptide phosphotransferase/UDP-N-acetylglucosamine-1-phosphate transferase